MENLLIYFVKVNGLIALFYLMYVLFLRKETFFTSNRWYLISGLILSLLLPLITFTKTIWIEPEPIVYENVKPIIHSTLETIPVEETFDWSVLFLGFYACITFLIILKIGIELVSFFRRIQKQNKQKEVDYTLVDSNSSENPFSFFSYIVINKEMFTEEELQHILTHESIHVKQKHSFDVLLGKVYCALFWANPIIWLYRKAMLQNLEFIADNETFQQIENKYLYQRTLLKVVTHQHNLSITNQFYQSLIKKRIVMLHTNQSHKKNVWKYATILPLLVGFMLLFQIETVAQVKENSKIVNTVEAVAIGFSWDKNATDEEMKSDTEELKKQGIDYKFSKVKRNKNGEIIAIKIEFNDGKGNKGVKEIKGDDPIEPIYFNAEEGRIGFTTEPDYSDYVIDEKLSKQFGTEIKVKMVKVTDDSDYPTPPTPPNYPFKNMPNPPKAPKFPATPNVKAPTDINDKKAWKKYEAEMEKFALAWENSAEIKKYEADMEAYAKKMAALEPEMIAFEEKMRKFEDDMEVYQKHIEKSSVEYYINDEKFSKEDVEKMQTDEIESINVRKSSSPNRIEIKKNK